MSTCVSGTHVCILYVNGYKKTDVQETIKRSREEKGKVG